ncbi:MAG: hypothetical protein AAF654_06100 [Myxococcota bacterium]
MSDRRPEEPDRALEPTTGERQIASARVEHSATHAHLQSLALVIRAAGVHGRAAFLDAERTRLVHRQRALRTALNADNGDLQSARAIGHALTRLFRAVSEYQELHPMIEADLFGLRDSCLRTFAEQFTLTVREELGAVREVDGENTPVRRLARTILHETTLAWSSMRAPRERAAGTVAELDRLSKDELDTSYWSVASGDLDLPTDQYLHPSERTLAVPFVYRPPGGSVVFIPAGSKLRCSEDTTTIDSIGVILRSNATLVLAGTSRIIVDPLRLSVASGTHELFSYAVELGTERETPVSMLSAERLEIADAIEMHGLGVFQARAQDIVANVDELLYQSDKMKFGFDPSEPFPVISASRTLQTGSVSTLRTATSPAGERETYVELAELRLCDAEEALELVDAELRLTDSLDGESRYRLSTRSLRGRLGPYETNARGRSTVDVQLTASGTVSTLSISNPATLTLARDDQTLAITDGKVSLHHRHDGRTTRAIDALKASIRDGDDLLTIELGRLSLTRDETGAGRTQMTGKSFRGRYKGIDMSGDDVGLQVTIDADGAPSAIQSTGRAMTLSDDWTELIANNASLEVELTSRKRFSRIIHQTGITELSSSELGTLTFRGNSTLDLEYHRARVSGVRADAEELSWTQPNGSQLDMRDATAALDLDEHAAPRRATLETGTLAWRGADGFEVATFGAGAQVEFNPSGQVLHTVGGIEGMTVRTRGGIAQVDQGALTARYDEAGNFHEASVDAIHASFYADNSSVFDVEQGTLTVSRVIDGGSRTLFEAERIQHDRGCENLILDHAQLTLEQRSDGTASIDARYQTGQLSTARAEFELAPGSDLQCDFDTDGLGRLAGDVTAASYLDGDERLTLTEGYFDGSFRDGILASFDAKGAITYGRVNSAAFATRAADISVSELEDGGRELILSGVALGATDGKRRFEGTGPTEIRFHIASDGTPVSTSLRGERFVIQDGSRRYRFDGTEVNFSFDGDIHLVDGSLQLYLGDELVEEIACRDTLLSFATDGSVSTARLLSDVSAIAGAFGTVRTLETRVAVGLNHGEVISVSATHGAAHVALNNGIDLALERGHALIEYNDHRVPTFAIQAGRALLNGDFGRLILPEGFELSVTPTENGFTFEGVTPNVDLDHDANVRSLNGFGLRLTQRENRTTSLRLRGSVSLDHPTRRVRLHNGELSIDCDPDQLTYRGRSDSLELAVNDWTLRPGVVTLGASIAAEVANSDVAVHFLNNELSTVELNRGSVAIAVFDSETESEESLRLTNQRLELTRDSDGSGRILVQGHRSTAPMALGLALAGVDFSLDGALGVEIHLTDDGKLAGEDGLVARVSGPFQLTRKPNGMRTRVPEAGPSAREATLHVALRAGLVLRAVGCVDSNGLLSDQSDWSRFPREG